MISREIISSRETCDTTIGSDNVEDRRQSDKTIEDDQIQRERRRLLCCNNNNLSTCGFQLDQPDLHRQQDHRLHREKRCFHGTVVQDRAIATSDELKRPVTTFGRNMSRRNNLGELKRGFNAELFEKLKRLASSTTAQWVRPLPARPDLTDVLKGPDQPVKGVNK